MSTVMQIPDFLPPYLEAILAKHSNISRENCAFLSVLPLIRVSADEFLHQIFLTCADNFPWVTGFAGDPKINGKWGGRPVENGIIPWFIKPNCNNYFSISTFSKGANDKPRRVASQFSACYLIVLDDIGTKVSGKIALLPSYIIETSPANYQYGYIFSAPCYDAVLVNRLINALISKGLSDPGMKDVTRYARLPVGINGKDTYVKALGSPFVVNCHEWHPDRRYTIDEIISGFDLNLDPPPAAAERLALPVSGTADNYVLAELKRRGLYKQPGSSPGKHDITCPWVSEHSDQADNGTGYIEPCAEYPGGGFNCFHGHCDGRTLKDLKAFLGLCQTDDNSDPMAGAVTRLAKLSPLQYDKVRKAEAKTLEVRTETLDDAVKSARKGEGKNNLLFTEVEPWGEPVDPAQLLTDIAATVRRFIVCCPEVSYAVALWVAMTWFIDVIQVAPLAVITAPEKRCGKTQLLTILARLTARAITASSISPAALFRTIEACSPTLLIDEADAFMKDNEEIRGLLNSGHTRDSAYVIRTVGEDFTPTKFSTWGAKALAGIGHLADTLMDRSVNLELRRKLPHEKVDRIRYAEPGLFDDLRSKLARFADDNSERVRLARPDLPTSLNDRAQDNWEPLLAIAKVAGVDWFKIGTAAALKLSGGESLSLSIGTELLSDIQEIFEHKKIEKISTAELILILCADDEKPWATYNRGNPIKPRQIATRLKGYGIHSKSIRVGYGGTPKGYNLNQFQEVFDRYLSPSVSATTPQVSIDGELHVAD